MRLNDDLAVLALDAQTMMGPSVLNLAVVLDEVHGPVLVDTGLPGMAPAVEAALAAEGVSLKNLSAIALTHHDLDHIGALPELAAASDAQVLASAEETPYIAGGQRAQKLPPLDQVEAVLAGMPEERRETMRAVMTAPPRPVPVTRALHDGDMLPLAGGVQVVLTPGHTAGHTSFFLTRSRVLLAGDALTARAGQLQGPMAQATADLRTAHASVQRLAELEPAAIVCYHGGLVQDDAAGQLRRLAASLS
ncbi:MBL fold metallo-hydrolase [Deinococcus hohokamensis]|uniref:MBL fold metallo-hydrolase n=1 Tax=Deinococcus hohokamensis TaxID=309883 RepID=A0ABV9ICB1_9DEIO